MVGIRGRGLDWRDRRSPRLMCAIILDRGERMDMIAMFAQFTTVKSWDYGYWYRYQVPGTVTLP